MKKYITFCKISALALAVMLTVSCKEKILDEVPLTFLSPDNAYNSLDAFENGIVTLHKFARDEQNTFLTNGLGMYYEMSLGTDVASIGEHFSASSSRFWDYTLINSNYIGGIDYWAWAYQFMLSNANTIIHQAEISTLKWSDADKNAVIAEAKFFRAYTYNALVNLFGPVPLVVDELTAPKLDFVRATKVEVLTQVMQDLEFASTWLPAVEAVDGRISKAAADHLLSEVYISMGLTTQDNTYYDKSIAAATRVISNPRYQLMTVRFGDHKDLPGDVYHDLFWDYNVNRSSGNTETIWALQYENLTIGGGGNGSTWARAWGPRFFDLKDPSNNSGMIICDSLGRPIGWVRPTNLVFYDVWKNDWNDMRNSQYNIRRTWYWNNPASAYVGQQVVMTAGMDTMWTIYPYLRKCEGDFATPGAAKGYMPKDIYRMRLAETYLLRGEAYMWKGDLASAAADINVVRARANATPALPSDINIDYILDERVRELIVEEPRRRTLNRVGKLYERTVKYNSISGKTIQPFNELWPIPQSAIDANSGTPLGQNPGYN